MPAARIEHGLLVTGHDLETLHYAVTVTIRARKRNGLPPLPSLTRLLHLMSGHTDTPKPSRDDSGVHEPVPITEAAALLDCSPRHARRLAPQLGGRKHRGRWTVDRQALSEHIQGRSA